MKVFMVDDSPPDRKLCRILLEQKYGSALEFSEASSGGQGIQQCLSTPQDCVLLDYKLPDMTGLEFLSGLPASAIPGTGPGFAIVMLTGLGNEQVAVDAMKAGAQDYLVKDRMTAASLHLAVSRAYEKVGLLRALQTERDRLAVSLQELAMSLQEKEALLQEVHHRVKNNLQVIASLLRLQAGAAVDTGAIHALRESVHRVESMALIHDQLYQSNNFQEIDMARHVASLTTRVAESYGIPIDRVTWHVGIESLSLAVGQAIPAGLILNELISNAFKHAFPGGRRGSMVVSGARHGESVALEVRDDGVGFPEATLGLAGGTGELRSQPFGLKIVRILTRQLQGTFAIENRHGAVCRLRFAVA